jgi:hypothetical protein
VLGVLVVFTGLVLWTIGSNVAADDLAVGTCFDVPARETGISTVRRHDCTAAHDAEVFHVGELTAPDRYPDDLTFDEFVEDSCLPAFAAYVGEDFETSEELDLGYFFPDADAWDAGDRTVSCYIVRVDEAKLTNTVRDSAGS